MRSSAERLLILSIIYHLATSSMLHPAEKLRPQISTTSRTANIEHPFAIMHRDRYRYSPEIGVSFSRTVVDWNNLDGVTAQYARTHLKDSDPQLCLLLTI